MTLTQILALTALAAALALFVTVMRRVRARVAADPAGRARLGESRYLFRYRAALEHELHARRARDGEADTFFGVDARGLDFIVHSVVRADGVPETWAFNDVDDLVDLTVIPFPVTGTFASDLEVNR